MSKLSPTQRTLRELRNQGRVAAVVERWNQHGGTHGIRQDLFGIVDVLALDPKRGFVGVQACAGSGFAAHFRKLTIDNAQASLDWLQTPGGVLEIWAWRKLVRKRGGKAKIWVPRVVEVTLEDIASNLLDIVTD